MTATVGGRSSDASIDVLPSNEKKRSEHPAGAQVQQLALLTPNSLGVLGIGRAGGRSHYFPNLFIGQTTVSGNSRPHSRTRRNSTYYTKNAQKADYLAHSFVALPCDEGARSIFRNPEDAVNNQYSNCPAKSSENAHCKD